MKKGKGRNNGLLPNSLRIISSCLKTVSTNASTVASSVRSTGASVAASMSSSSEDHKDQVTWAGFDKLELGPSAFKRVLLLGYENGFQVLDVKDSSNFSELVSKRDGPVTFLQMQPLPASSDDHEGFRSSHPLLLVVAGEEKSNLSINQNHGNLGGLGRDGNAESHSGNICSPMTVQFYSLKSHCYVHVLKFRSAVCMVRCSSRIVAVGLSNQIYCFDALTLENKFSVLTYPVPRMAGQGPGRVNVGYGPMAVGPRWLAYASNNPLLSSTGRLSPQNLISSPGVSPSTSPGGGSLVARYAMESSKQLANGIINLGDLGYKTVSKYCHEMLPDGSNSPVSPSSGWKVGRLAGTEMDNAGMVVVKDFISRAVISQFKAHTSPISALSFDPSGTLLVTASIYGNNINIFRILPSSQNGASTSSYNWNSSHVHLYKLHRGITSAIIQDICFSHYSQWIAIVSSKGTCHIFVLSPFGGDTGFQTQNSQVEEPSLLPVLSLPWWSTSSFNINQQPIPPPQPVVLSAVSRIKYNDSGWLNSVSNAAASATGKVFVPSGAVAAVFHNSISHSSQHSSSMANSLEHLLVYTPSGHVIQHKLLPSVGIGPSDSFPRTRPGSFMQIQEEDLRVKVEPVQWWDVCRRLDWPEKEESVLGTIYNRHGPAETILDESASIDPFRMDFLDINNTVGERKLTDILKPRERSHWYLSNAEVQISSGRLSIWHKSKICIYMMSSPNAEGYVDGEFEIEKLSVNEVEIKRKELLPVFDHFHSIKSYWNDSGLYSTTSAMESHQTKNKVIEETVICHSKPSSLSSTESSDGGSSRRIENHPDFDQLSNEKPCVCQIINDLSPKQRGSCNVGPPSLNEKSPATLLTTPEDTKTVSLDDSSCITNDMFSVESRLIHVARRCVAEGAPSCNGYVENEVSMLNADTFGPDMNIIPKLPALSNGHMEVNFEQFLQEGHCKAPEIDGCSTATDVLPGDLDSSSSCFEKGKSEDDGEDDELLGGMFMFSEEG